MDTSEEEEAVVTAQRDLETALSVLESMSATPYFIGNGDANVALIMQRMHKIQFQVSISSTFYKQIFCTNVISAAFSMFVHTYLRKKSGRNDIRTKETRKKTLMKLTLGSTKRCGLC